MQRTSGCWPLWTTWTTLALSIAWTAWTTQAFALVKVGETAPFSLESNVANVRARTWPFCDWHCDSIRGFHNLHIHCGRANPNFFWYPFWANHHVVSLGTVPKYVFPASILSISQLSLPAVFPQSRHSTHCGCSGLTSRVSLEGGHAGLPLLRMQLTQHTSSLFF